MLIKSTYKLKDFLQKLPNGKEVFDFKKIESTPFKVFLMITERGAKGKTFNLKDHMKNEFIKNGDTAIWLMNTIPLLEKQLQDFTKDIFKPSTAKMLPKETLEFWKNIKIKGDLNKTTSRITALRNGKQEDFIKPLPLGHAELMKGARPGIKRIGYEEFNVKFNVVRKPVEMFDSLLHSMEDLVSLHKTEQDLRLYLFGNNKSLNNPLIARMGVTHLEHEIAELRDENGNPLMLIIAPQFDTKEREEIEENNVNNWIFQMSKQMGTAKHSYFNESLSDEMNSIVRYLDSEELSKQLTPQLSIHHNKEFYNVYITKQGKYHIINVDKEDVFKTALFALHRRDIIENVPLNKLYRKGFLKNLSADNITFESVVAREIFVKSITT